MKTYNYLLGTTMILSVMFLTSCQKESIIEPTNTIPTHTPWEESTGADYQIEFDLNTILTVEKSNCPVDHSSNDSKSSSDSHDCELTYVAYGDVEGFSSTLGESKGAVSLKYNQTMNEITGTITLSFPNTKENLVLNVRGQMDDETLKVSSDNTFADLYFLGNVSIDNMLEVFQPDSQKSTSMMIVGDLN